MRELIAVAVIASIASLAPPASAHSHLVSPELVQSRLKEAGQHRIHDLAAVLGILSRPEVREALAAFKVDPDDVALRVPTLSDEELHDLADRVARLDIDPRSSGVGRGLLIALAVIGVAFTVLLIVCSTSDCD